jgi:N-methylhydantoinase B
LAGGADGARNVITITRQGQRGPCTCQAAGLPLAVGDIITIESGGGGGYGNPADRAPTLVAQDLNLGYISQEAAQSLYGYHLPMD